MREMRLVIPGTLPTLNEIIDASKGSKYKYARMKLNTNDKIGWSVKACKLKPVNRANFIITWICKNKRKDKDNIMAGQKFIFDALQETGILQNDGWKQIGDVTHCFGVDQENPRIEVEITEVKS